MKLRRRDLDGLQRNLELHVVSFPVLTKGSILDLVGLVLNFYNAPPKCWNLEFKWTVYIRKIVNAFPDHHGGLTFTFIFTLMEIASSWMGGKILIDL